MHKTVEEHISANWDNVVRECRHDKGDLVGIPYPFTIPAVGRFEALYYWDTYFTNVGLLLSEKPMLAKTNVDNMLNLISRYGFMPNSNGTYHRDHSQPPFLSIMVRDIYEYYGDKVWLIGAYEMLCREYEFWITQRSTPIGLSRFDTNITDKSELEKSAAEAEERLGLSIPEDRATVGRFHLSTCESGYDYSSRYGFAPYNFAPACLNSLLYALEVNMAYFADELGKDDSVSEEWLERAETRKALMNKYLLDENGLFRDYDFVHGKLSPDFSAASVYPMFCGLADKDQARSFAENLHRLEAEYGIASNEKNDTPGLYQWGYPNGWACHQQMFISALDKYGYKTDAKRIAEKYISLADRVFEKTHNLWEKYNIVEGSILVAEEHAYEMPAMMGWTAGAYLYAKDYLNKTN